jgi:hypothetical protein
LAPNQTFSASNPPSYLRILRYTYFFTANASVSPS